MSIGASSNMLSSLTTKLAMKKLGISSKALDFSPSTAAPEKADKKAKAGHVDDDSKGGNWAAWMTVQNLPLTVQPWLTPRPPPVPVAEPPQIGSPAPLDREGRILVGDGRRVMVVFLRCVGCAFAQKTFLALRAIAMRNKGTLSCIAVSHSSPDATRKWLDLLGGAWDVEVVVDESRTLYAEWGLGVASFWYVLNPTTQIAGFKTDKAGWLGSSVAGALQRTEGYRQAQERASERLAEKQAQGRKRGWGFGKNKVAPPPPAAAPGPGVGGEKDGVTAGDDPLSTMGNKWQESGAWAVDGRRNVVWGGKAARADDVMDLDAGVRALGL